MKNVKLLAVLMLLFIFPIFSFSQDNSMELLKVQKWKGHLKIEYYEKTGEGKEVKETKQTIEGDVTLSAKQSPSGYYFIWPSMFDTSKHWAATLSLYYKETSHCVSDGTEKNVSFECNKNLKGKFRLMISIQGGKLTISPLMNQDVEINMPCKGSSCEGNETEFPILLSFNESEQLPLPASGTTLKGTKTFDSSDNSTNEIRKITYTWEFMPAN